MADPSVSWSSMGELRVNLFFPTRDGFPEVLKEGDICICKNMNVSENYRDQTLLVYHD